MDKNEAILVFWNTTEGGQIKNKCLWSDCTSLISTGLGDFPVDLKTQTSSESSFGLVCNSAIKIFQNCLLSHSVILDMTDLEERILET